jgi:hypothetical protein
VIVVHSGRKLRRTVAGMSEPSTIDRVSDREYRMQTDVDGQTFESLFRMGPDLVEKLDLPDVDEKTIVEATARFFA